MSNKKTNCTYFVTDNNEIDMADFENVEFKVNEAPDLSHYARPEPIRPNELLYDHKGQPVAIKTNGQILAIIEGDL
jgi:hypothetical protein